MYPRINDILLDLDFEYIFIFYIWKQANPNVVYESGTYQQGRFYILLTRGEHDAAIVLIYYRFSIKTHVKYYVGRLPALRKQGQTASCELKKKSKDRV